MKYKDILRLREAIKFQYSHIDSLNIKNKGQFTELINGITGVNKFITIYDYLKGEIVFHHQVKEYLGYESEEFSISGINNAEDAPYKIIHPDDIEHKLRYDYIILFHLMNNNTPSLKDSYEIFMRIVTKDGVVKRVNRQSYFYQLNEEGYPISQIDVWKLLPNDNPYVKVNINHVSENNLLDEFYIQNRKQLDFNITSRQIEILRLRHQRLDNKSVAEQLFISIKTVENHIHNLKDKMQSFYIKNGVKEQIYNMNDMIHFIKKYSIFPFTN